ncbi:phosphate signaling complex protein PhoU [Parvularcula lutaonensis]|uniref:Phosphate-specific transport system accessory protein PhoU n=1 Tax=Parvularcula lutaonensis TaxID=491923 RepID=A0ABV7M8M8_9PROT|nr:phosphate signaling complex protein PhoU [Parvularcula lutaonensis]GGY45254.1 phosphate transport system regulatory protein PhoU [Parvularcula lutaonensis]
MPFGILRQQADRIEKLDVALATMGGLVEQQLTDALAAFEQRDASLARGVVKRDAETDRYERQIEHLVADLFHERRRDQNEIRRMMAAVRIASEMERVGDLAKNVSRRSIIIAEADDDGEHSKHAGVVRMGRISLRQFSEALDALFRRNADAARAVRNADDQVDDIYNSVFSELMTLMNRVPGIASTSTHLIFVAKNFERIGDHATNIAERVHYALTGEELTSDRIKTDVTSTLIAAE